MYGAQARILTDQGTAFTSNMVAELCQFYGINHSRTSPYHPQTNGLVEQSNQTLGHMIGALDDDSKAIWPKLLPMLTMAYNATRRCDRVQPILSDVWLQTKVTR